MMVTRVTVCRFWCGEGFLIIAKRGTIEWYVHICHKLVSLGNTIAQCERAHACVKRVHTRLGGGVKL